MVEQELRNAAVAGHHVATLPGLVGAAQSASADFASAGNATGPRFGVILRYQSPGNHYLLYRQAGGLSKLRISRVVNGVETVLAATSIKNPLKDVFFRLGGRAVGNTLTLELDGVDRLSVVDTTFDSGSPGLLLGSRAGRSHRADDFSATVQ